MASKVEVMRQEAREALEEIANERAKFDEDNLPSLEDSVRLEALVSAQADREADLERIEKTLRIAPNAPQVSRSFPHSPTDRTSAAEEVAIKRIGDLVMNHPAYVEWHANNVSPDGKLYSGRRPDMRPIDINGVSWLDRNAALFTGDSATSGGAFITNDRTGIYNALGRRPLDVLDIIRTRPTSSDVIEFVRQTSRSNAAIGVAEATATSGSSGEKPESDAAFEVVTAPVKTIANWNAITRQAAADAPQLRSIIEEELRDNLREEVEEQVVVGSGGVGFTGIMNTTGTQTQAFATDIFTTARTARTLVRTVGRTTPTAYVLTPLIWQAIDLLQDNEARYYYGGPAAVGTPRLWGLPVVECESLAANTGIVGNFEKAILFDRQSASISISDSHADFFIRNLIAILAELRAAFAVIQPNAFVEIAFA